MVATFDPGARVMATGAEVPAARPGDCGGFLRWVELDESDADLSRYPFTLPVVAGLRAAGTLELHPAVTFLAGDNGTAKSTLVEAIAVAAGFNAEGGSTVICTWNMDVDSREASVYVLRDQLADHLTYNRGWPSNLPDKQCRTWGWIVKEHACLTVELRDLVLLGPSIDGASLVSSERLTIVIAYW